MARTRCRHYDRQPSCKCHRSGRSRGDRCALNSAQADSGVDAIVILGAGKTFIAGADLAEFASTGQGPNLHGLLVSLEDSSKPSVVAVHGPRLVLALKLPCPLTIAWLCRTHNWACRR